MEEPRSYDDEWVIREWFERWFVELGFERIIPEYIMGRKRRNPEYLRIRRSGVYRGTGMPDYFALKDGKWLRIEVEANSKGWTDHYHRANQRDILIVGDMKKGWMTELDSVNSTWCHFPPIVIDVRTLMHYLAHRTHEAV